MTTFDRFEREIPRLMDELAPARLPDYFDDLLQSTASEKQRPAWSSPERWLPMRSLSRPMPTHVPRWQLVALAALLVLAATAVLVAVGSRLLAPSMQILPADRLVATDPNGDLVSVDPQTGATLLLATTPATVTDPAVSPDRRHVAFLDRTSDFRLALMLVDADGTGLRTLYDPGTDLYTPLWTPDSRQVLIFRGDRSPALTLVDIGTAETTPMILDPALGDVHAVAAMPGGGWLVTLQVDDVTSFAILDATGATVQRYDLPNLMNQPSVSADGRFLAYTTWGGPEGDGRTHVIERATGEDRLVSPVLDMEFNETDPVLSPDGSHLLVRRFTAANDPGFDVVLMDLVAGTERVLGGIQPGVDGGFARAFSPDGRSVLVRSALDGTTWTYDVTSGEGRQVPATLGGAVVWPADVSTQP